jgi:hypothetical protein
MRRQELRSRPVMRSENRAAETTARPAERHPGFVLYVEGPRDRGVLEAWARRWSRPLGRKVADATVILGGRQPARAADHFRTLRERHAAERGLCILDRDDEPSPGVQLDDGSGLHVYTWPRRQIESYLLVQAAIRRSVRLSPDDLRLKRFFREELPAANDEAALGALDAKALFGQRGPLAALLGRPVRPIHVARAMQRHELHRDVLRVLRWIRRDGTGTHE